MAMGCPVGDVADNIIDFELADKNVLCNVKAELRNTD